jgi:secreted trypsin-like serine protease
MKRLIPFSSLFAVFTFQSAFAGNFILGGQSVKPKDPVAASTVAVFTPHGDGTGSLCSGTLIGKDMAVTAAHCITPGITPEVVFNRNLHAKGTVQREAEGVAVNPKYRKSAGKGMDEGDIALVRFQGAAPAGYHAVPTVANDAAIRKNEEVTLAGYGISNAQKKTGAGHLRRTNVRVLDNRPGKSEMIVDQTHGHGACHGDSGGPAYVRQGGRIALAGLTNRSYPDAAPDDCAHDAVYTKLPDYKKWIQANQRKLEEAPRMSAPLGRVHKIRRAPRIRHAIAGVHRARRAKRG